jgi:hypothetical protein
MAATLRTARLPPREELPGVAARALLDGVDSPSLRVLAGLVGVELERAPELLGPRPRRAGHAGAERA